MSNTLVSICIPSYNEERYIIGAIKSVLSQTWSPVEVIVVDDGSTDKTRALLKECDQYSNVEIIFQENQGCAAAARNRAYQESSGELIKFFDADDLLSPEFIERQVHELNGSRSHIASAEWARFYENPSEAAFEPEPVWKDMDPVDWLVTAWSDARPMMQPALWLIPRPILEHTGTWDERLTLIDDFEFSTRVLLESEGIRFTPGAKLYYRSGLEDSLSGKQSREHVESAFLSLMTGTQHLIDQENTPRTRRAAANMLQDFIYKHYPYHSGLREKVNQRIKELGGSDLSPQGPPGFQVLRRVVGWKVARRVERFATRHGLNRASLAAKLGLS